MSVGLPTKAEHARPPEPEGEPALTVDAPELPVTVIEPRSGWAVFGLVELWRYRELLLFLIWRDVKIRYKQTAVGAAWAVFQPILVMGAMVFALGRIAGGDDPAAPYWLFVLCGLVPWTFFASAVTQTGMSVVNNQHLVTKVYFPRLLLPLSAVGLAGVDFAVGFGVLMVAAVAAGVWGGWNLLAIPLTLAVLGMFSLGFGIAIAAVTVRYRDFRVVLPLVMQLWMFLTPAIYAQKADLYGPTARAVLMANPANAAVANFRSAVLGGPFDWAGLGVAAALGAALLVGGAAYFRRAERGFSDVI